jgi:precorrin-2 dehydrogenase/sirohydrochlorin ferrochelatase
MNTLYPIFLKTNQLNILIVGGGNVGHEKLSFLLKSSPNSNVEIVSIKFNDEIIELAKTNKITMIQRAFDKMDLANKHIVVIATEHEETNRKIYHESKRLNILTNVADTPELCDFYLGGIVTKGNVKIAISTNGKSPTTAKRLRQFFEEVVPENIDDLVQNLNQYRKKIKGDFDYKVSHLNEITKSLIK